MPHCYLTIDDSPSKGSVAFAEALAERDIPALWYCRGDHLASRPGVMAEVLGKHAGNALGNHLYSHRRASQYPLAEIIEEISRTEALLDAERGMAGRDEGRRQLRFPHLDRGAGGYVVDFDAWPQHRPALHKVFAEGLNVTLAQPNSKQAEKKTALQAFLSEKGYASPFKGIAHHWYTETEIAAARDGLYTYSTNDWMLTPRHLGKWSYKSLDDLKARIDKDPWLNADYETTHIILAHDQDGLQDQTLALIDHLGAKGCRFIAI